MLRRCFDPTYWLSVLQLFGETNCYSLYHIAQLRENVYGPEGN